MKRTRHEHHRADTVPAAKETWIIRHNRWCYPCSGAPNWARSSLPQTHPKIDPAPNSNTEKEPDDWVSGDDPMTGAQASYLKTLSEECGEPDSFQPDLTKAEASKRIDALKSKRRPVQHR